MESETFINEYQVHDYVMDDINEPFTNREKATIL